MRDTTNYAVNNATRVLTSIVSVSTSHLLDDLANALRHQGLSEDQIANVFMEVTDKTDARVQEPTRIVRRKQLLEMDKGIETKDIHDARARAHG